VQKHRPDPDRISQKTYFLSNLSDVLCKNDVYGNRVSIETIDSGAEDEIVGEPANMLIPAAPQMIGRYPPDKI
jgi:hypothetical protein